MRNPQRFTGRSEAIGKTSLLVGRAPSLRLDLQQIPGACPYCLFETRISLAEPIWYGSELVEPKSSRCRARRLSGRAHRRYRTVHHGDGPNRTPVVLQVPSIGAEGPDPPSSALAMEPCHLCSAILRVGHPVGT